MDNFIDISHIGPHFCDAPEEEPFPPSLYKVRFAEGKQELPDFGLEDDKQGDQPHTEKCPEDLPEKFHLQRIGHAPDEKKGNDPEKDIDGNGTFQEVVKLVKDESDKKYVNHIQQPDLQKTGKEYNQHEAKIGKFMQ